MRRLAGLCMLIVTPFTASAHEIAADAGILERIGHELVGLHHLPVTFALILAGLLLYRMRKRKASRTR